ATEALTRIRRRPPDVMVLDVRMPGMTGIELSQKLKSTPATAGIAIVLLTGSTGDDQELAEAGADAVLRTPFRPLELLSLVARLAGSLYGVPLRVPVAHERDEDALLLYARDLRHMLELERGQRDALQAAYLETVAALASALETKDTGTRAHSQRV